MNKILLGTTGLFGAALLSTAAVADTPKVTIGGFIDFQAGITSDDQDSNQRSLGFRNDTEVTINVEGKADSGLVYGAQIDLEADVTADADNEGLNASRTYIYLESDQGRVELGSTDGAAETLKLDASNIARATGGIDGAFSYFANFAPAGAGGFITTPSLFLTHGSTASIADETFNNLNKITYYSPSFSGFQFGVSYTPDSTDRGQTLTRTDNDGFSDIWDLAASYSVSVDDVDLNIAGTFVSGDSDLVAVEDISAWNIGATADLYGITLAGSYGDWDDSGVASGLDENNYFTLGAAYDFGPFAASATYLSSEFQTATGNNDFENLVIGADYALAPGLTPYAEVAFYEFDAAGGPATNDNEGTLVIVGTQVAF